MKSAAEAIVLAAGLLAAALSTGKVARAAPVWVGDMETGDLSQWNNQLNGNHITVVDTPVVQGAHAAQIQLTNDAVWPNNGLKRVELNHSPAAGRTAEGAELYFAWSFRVPVTLPQDPSQQIGYWESNQSYQQMMAFEVEGELIRFVTRRPQYKKHWEADGAVTAGAWHRIALHVKWSKNAAQGLVDVWFDGSQVVTQGAAQTLADDNRHFTQVGLLRSAIEFTDAPLLFLDDAVEGDSLDDVRPDLPGAGGQAGAGGQTGTDAGDGSAGSSGGAPGAGGSGATGGAAQGGGPSDAAGGSAAGGKPPQNDGSPQAAGGAAAEPASDDAGCGCRTTSAPLAPASWGAFALLFGAAIARRRR